MVISCFKPSYNFDAIYDSMYASENIYPCYNIKYLKDCICVVCGIIITLWNKYGTHSYALHQAS